MDRHHSAALKPFPLSCFVLTLVLFATLLAGCLAVPRVKTPLHDSPRGRVTLRTFSDPSFRVTHPQIVEQSVLTQLLRGMHVQEQQEPVTSFITGQALTERAFTEEDIAFLAPLLASALRQVTAEEQVIFLLSNQTTTGTEQTEGLLYLSGPALQFTLTQHRLNAPRLALPSRPNSSFNRPKRWRLVFYPEGAVLHTTSDSQTPIDESTLKSLAISYERLPTYPASAFRIRSTRGGSSVSESAALSRTTNSSPSGNAQQTERELKAVKEEMEKLRKSLREQDSKLEDLENQITQPQN